MAYTERQLLFLVILALSLLSSLAFQFEKVTITDTELPADIPPLGESAICTKNTVCRSTSELIVNSVISPSSWSPGKPVTIRFQTADSANRFDQGVTLAVYLYLLLPPSSGRKVPVHKFQGLIVENKLIFENTNYDIEFVPPTWLSPGNYLVVLGLNGKILDGPANKYIVQMSAKAEIDFKKATNQAIDQVVAKFGESEKTSSSEEEPASFTDIPTDVLRQLLKPQTSVSEVCNICTISKDTMAKCNSIAIENWKHATGVPDNSERRIKPISKALSVSDLCRIGEVEVAIQRLEFKYISLDGMTSRMKHRLAIDTYGRLEEALNGLKLTDDKTNSILTDTTLFFNPLIPVLDILIENFESRLDDILQAFQHFYNDNPLTRQIKIHNRNGRTIDEIERVIAEAVELPRSTEFKKSLAQSLECNRADENILLSIVNPSR
ncbi:hypothetical protein BKA69DRAFT_510449 [Paraphysoderma sedebokerense]|nr:hypothetical protein BKA69DRAFT_510449 [Paraphysoderma sedebokerense]